MNIVDQTIESIQRGDLVSAIVDRVVSTPHVLTHTYISDEYLMEKNGIIIDLKEAPLSSLMKYRLKKGRLQYEAVESGFIEEYLPSDCDVIDLGAGIGFTSCMAAAQIRPESEVIAVEANTKLEKQIIRNAELNRAPITPVIAAYAPSKSRIKFPIQEDFLTSSVYNESSNMVEVSTTSISECVSTHDIEEMSVIADIEGSEAEFSSEIDILTKKCKMLIIETHENKNRDVVKSLDTIEAAGFDLIDSLGSVKVYENNRYDS